MVPAFVSCLAIQPCVRKSSQLTRGGRLGVGSAQHDSAGLDGVETLPDHTDDGAGKHCVSVSGSDRVPSLRETGIGPELSCFTTI